MQRKRMVRRASVAMAAAGGLLWAGPVASAQGVTAYAPTASTTYAGYSESYLNSYFTVSETLVVPTLVCTTKATDPIVVFAETSGTGSANQPLATAAALEMGCIGKQAVYQTALVADSSASNGNAVSAGDQITLSAEVTATTEHATVTDNTTQQSMSVQGTGYSPSGLDSLVEPNSPTGIFPKFSPIAFTNVSWDNSPIPPRGIQSYDKVDSQNQVQMKVTVPTQGRTAFTVNFVRNT
jgi:Peptidase A4 family